jgi:hypothetical protein
LQYNELSYKKVKSFYFQRNSKKNISAVGVYMVSEKLKIGMQQLMAGARKWRTHYICRDDLACLNEEFAKITGIPYIMDAYHEEALAIIDA